MPGLVDGMAFVEVLWCCFCGEGKATLEVQSSPKGNPAQGNGMCAGPKAQRSFVDCLKISTSAVDKGH